MKIENPKIGGFCWKYDGKYHFADLFAASMYDHKWCVKPHKKGLSLFRYETSATKGLCFPAILINVKKHLLYFFGENDQWETRGIKADSLWMETI